MSISAMKSLVVLMEEKMGSALPSLPVFIKHIVHATIESCNGNKSKAARVLGISRITLSQYMRGHVLLVKDEVTPFMQGTIPTGLLTGKFDGLIEGSVDRVIALPSSGTAVKDLDGVIHVTSRDPEVPSFTVPPISLGDFVRSFDTEVSALKKQTKRLEKKIISEVKKSKDKPKFQKKNLKRKITGISDLYR